MKHPAVAHDDRRRVASQRGRPWTTSPTTASRRPWPRSPGGPGGLLGLRLQGPALRGPEQARAHVPGLQPRIPGGVPSFPRALSPCSLLPGRLLARSEAEGDRYGLRVTLVDNAAAREDASQAVALLLLCGRPEAAPLADQVERDLLPAITGLVRRSEGGRRR